MTLYNTLIPGQSAKSLDTLTATADTKGTIFAVPSRPGGGDEARTVTWEATIVGGPSALVMELQGAMNNVEAEFTILDTIDATSDYMRTVGPVLARFLRIRQTSRTGGTSVTGKITVS